MVIQRIQSLYLLIAAVLMGLYTFAVPVASATLPGGASAPVYLYSDWTMCILGLLSTVLLLTAIFLYNNLKFQIKVCLACTATVLFTYLITIWILLMFRPELSVCWAWPSIIAGVALLLTLLARGAMKADYATLRSYDRLR